jgi:hypothetical protein
MPRGNINLKKDLEQLFSDFKWDFIGIADDKKNIIPIPKNSTCITAIVEQKALEILNKFVKKKYKCELIRAPTTREYPDAILRGGIFGDKIIALDIKTARKVGQDRISGLTIGSYAGYFLHPDEKRAGCSIPYGNFDEHWIVAFLYKWDPRKNSKEMVSEIDCVANLKWKMASKSTGTGTTKHIGSAKSIQALKDGRGGFDSEREFLKFWRNKGRSLK